MTLVPTTSPLISHLQAAAHAAGLETLPETIVVRGYPGPPSDVLWQATAILAANSKDQIDPADIADIIANPDESSPWRIYLSARRDCWVEVENWGRDVQKVLTETNADRLESFTVWLRARDAHGVPVCYRVVTIDVLNEEDGFISGRLVEDYMRQGASSNVVWDEQQFGPTTGKASTKRCF
jgi:hypothetical protein